MVGERAGSPVSLCRGISVAGKKKKNHDEENYPVLISHLDISSSRERAPERGGSEHCCSVAAALLLLLSPRLIGDRGALSLCSGYYTTKPKEPLISWGVTTFFFCLIFFFFWRIFLWARDWVADLQDCWQPWKVCWWCMNKPKYIGDVQILLFDIATNLPCPILPPIMLTPCT